MASDGSWSQLTMPDGTIYKEFYATTGWGKGLTTSTEVWSGGALKKWTTTAWTQDDESLWYQKNPRPFELNVYDAEGNRRRTTVQYSSYSLPEIVREWGGTTGDMLLRRSVTHYRWDAAFIDRRIIGLPSVRLAYEGESALVSKLEYHYDWRDGYMQAQAPSVGHDTANYGAGFDYGRGFLVGVQRYNVTAPDDGQQAIWLQLNGYNLAGALVWTQDWLPSQSGHRTNISYADWFSDSAKNALNTLAYPTTITDADNHSSTAQYHYDFGAVTRAQDPQGAAQTMQYDAVGRIERATNLVNNAYTRWAYGATYVQTFTTLVAGAPEAYAAEFYDGAGQVTAHSATNPGGVGGYIVISSKYDNMGRLIEQSNPTETNDFGTPVGDDAAGYQWTRQAYDWQGRPTLTTYPTGHTTERSYGGCGCAGGAVTTTRDERGRRRKLYQDTLGRLTKVEELNWDTSVYATTTYAYNARDQLTQSNQSGQLRTFEYDGHARLWRKTTPEQGATTYAYNADDTVQSVTDARGASTALTYNNRHLPTLIDYTAAGGAAATPDVSFAYDAAGNRTQMTDGQGSVTYQYDTLSRLTSETRNFTGVGSFTLSYGYNLAGQLTSVTNPWNAQVSYTHDAVGRTTAVGGANYYGVTNYAGGLKYRAFGALKEATYGNGRVLSQFFDARLRLTGYHVGDVMGWNYHYDKFSENSGRVTYAQNSVDPTLDRSYDYDHLGRLQYAHTGNEARGHAGISAWPPGMTPDGPYSQHTFYDQFGNLTQRAGWGGANPSYTVSFTNNRRTGAVYDASGNITVDGGQSYSYDTTGQQVTASFNNLQMAYDGDRLRVKKTEDGSTTYYLRSSVLGGPVVCELNSSGGWMRGYVYVGSQLLAVQQSGVFWTHQDPVTKSQRLTDQAGSTTTIVDLDPWGGETTRSVNSSAQPQRYTSYTRDANQSDEAMHRRYNRWWSRFDQPDPYDGSMSLAEPQSLNRYSYVQNDPVNFVDPSGLNMIGPGSGGFCTTTTSWNPETVTLTIRTQCYLTGGGGSVGGSISPISGIDLGGGGGGGGGVDHRLNELLPTGAVNEMLHCGVNPITGRHGINATASGNLGELRPGVGGRGGFRERTGGRHEGIDIAAPVGTPIHANRSGEVMRIITGHGGGYGNAVIIRHADNAYALYAHLRDAPSVSAGDTVIQGQVIGNAGRTGNVPRSQLTSEDHLHFGVKSSSITLTSGERFTNPVTYLNSPCP